MGLIDLESIGFKLDSASVSWSAFTNLNVIGVLRLIKGEWLESLVNYHYLVNLFQISINTMERGSGALEHKEGCNPISTSLRCIDFGFQIKCSWQTNQKAVDRVYTSRSRNCCFQWGKRHNFVLGESWLYIFERKLQLDCEQGAESSSRRCQIRKFSQEWSEIFGGVVGMI